MTIPKLPSRAAAWLLAAFLLAALAAPPPARPDQAEALAGPDPPPNAIWLEALSLDEAGQDYGSPQARKSVDGNPLTLDGVVYQHGVGAHANARWAVPLNAVAVRFAAMVGVDDERACCGSITFEAWVDGEKRADSGVLRGGDAPHLLSVDLTGAQLLELVVTDAGDDITNDHADWAGAAIILAPGVAARPDSLQPAPDPPMPIASGVPPAPAIHGPRIVGAAPGRPFLFLIPATGQGPLTFSAGNLPPGLSLDPEAGIISGSLQRAGETVVQLAVTGPRGRAARKLLIVGGEGKLALTPPMGWNSWNIWAGAVTDEKVRDAADWMVKSGLAAHGYQYLNIDDTWEGRRDADGEIQPNEKFGDMKALADYVHSKGLKLGLYSSPGPQTCAGHEGSYQHEHQDARTYARWGIDYLKYDWCSYGGVAKDAGLAELQRPYRTMRAALDASGRDIVYSLCQYGMGSVWEWGADVGGNLWRTTGDITDTWGSLSRIGFGHDGRERFVGPGRWNDPDMLVVGKLGWGSAPRDTRLTHNEQITHITLWALLAAPLLLGCDLSQLDQKHCFRFTLDLLTNDEVIDVDQDPLGQAAGPRAAHGLTEVWARPLWDGTLAVGLFNRGPVRAQVTARWADLGLSGPQAVRNLWQKRDLGTFADSFTASVVSHGAVLVKIGRPQRTDW